MLDVEKEVSRIRGIKTVDFWEMVNESSNLLGCVSTNELDAEQILNFSRAYLIHFHKKIGIGEVLNKIRKKYNPNILNVDSEEQKIERFTHGLFYRLGEEGIKQLEEDKENIFNYIKSVKDIDDIVSRCETGDMWNLGAAYSFEKIVEDHPEIKVGTEEFDEEFSFHLSEFHQLVNAM